MTYQEKVTPAKSAIVSTGSLSRDVPRPGA
jgi:hypothetical protein